MTADQQVLFEEYEEAVKNCSSIRDQLMATFTWQELALLSNTMSTKVMAIMKYRTEMADSGSGLGISVKDAKEFIEEFIKNSKK